MSLIATDTETGGLYPAVHALLSIGAVCSWDGSEYHAYITPESQPGKTVEAEAAAKNGYSREKWEARGARPLDLVFPEFLDWLAAKKEARPAALVLCHNTPFDRSFFSEAERITGRTIPHRRGWICSQMKMNELRQRSIIDADSSSLDTLAKLSEWPHDRSTEHNAVEDAKIALHGFGWLTKMAHQSEDTLRQLYADSLRERRSLEDILNTPEFHDFVKAVPLEAAHQLQRWGTKSDDGKTSSDWFWLIGYLAGKVLSNIGRAENLVSILPHCTDAETVGRQIAEARLKAMHHCITTAAACSNWHRALLGKFEMRPGIASPEIEKEEGRANG